MEPEGPSREELLRLVREMNAELQELRERVRGAEGEADWYGESLKARTRLLNERLKELNCLFETIRVARRPNLSFEEKASRIVELLPGAWQFADAACARAVVGNREFRSARYAEPRRVLAEPVLAGGERVGTLEVGYLRPLPDRDEGPFLTEERALLKVVAECLGWLSESAGPPGGR